MRNFTFPHTKKLLFTALILLSGLLAVAQYPVVKETSISTGSGANTHNVAIPGYAVNDLIIVFWSSATAGLLPELPAGWTSLYTQISSNYARMAMYWKATSGNPNYSVLAVNLDPGGISINSAHVVHVIQAGTYKNLPVAGTSMSGSLVTGSSNSPNPGSFTSGFGSVPTLWIAAAHSQYDGPDTPTGPGGYSGLWTSKTSNQVPKSADHARMTTAFREAAAATEDPGPFGLKNNVVWLANTVAIRGNGCIVPTITLGTIAAVCKGTTSASLPYSATTNGPTEYTIDWDATAEGQGFADVSWTALPASPITLTVPAGAAAGTYNATLKVRSEEDCESITHNISVTVNALPLAPVSGGDKEFCAGSTIPALSVTVGAGETADWYSVASAGTALATGSLTYTPTAAGTYYAEARNTTTGCVSASRTDIILTENPLPIAGISGNLSIVDGQSTTLTATGTAVSWEWSTTETTSSITVSPSVDTEYWVIITDANGCESEKAYATVTVSPGGFQGYFAPENWDLEGDGTVDDSQAPAQIGLEGPEYGSTELTICVGDGEVSFDWELTAATCNVSAGNIIWHTDDQKANSGETGNTQTVAAPSNLAAGDLIIVTLHYRKGVLLTGQDGFTLIRREAGGSANNHRATVIALYKIATGTETGFTFTTTGNDQGNDRWYAYATRVTGHSASNPIGNSNGNNSASGTVSSITVSGVTTEVDNALLVGAAVLGRYDNLTGPAGMTTITYSFNSAPNGIAAQNGYESRATAGPTGDRTWSGFTNAEASALLFVINPSVCSYSAYYTLNGVEYELEGTSGTVTGVEVSNGDILGFKVKNFSDTGSPAVLTISDFNAPEGIDANPGTITGGDEVCVGSTLQLVTDGAEGGEWSVNTPSVATIDAETGELTAVSAGTVTVTYTVDGCGVNYSTLLVTVNALPAIECPGDFTLCVDDEPYELSGTGVYEGSGVEETDGGYEFNPASAGPGTHEITYTVTDTETGCTNSCTFTITVKPVVVCPEDMTVYLTDEPVLLEGTPSGGVFSGEGVVYDEDLGAYFFDPSELDVDNYTVYYTVTDQNLCNTAENSCSFIVTVDGDPCANDETPPVIGACGQAFIVELYPVTFGRTTVWRGYLNKQAILNTITDNCSTITLEDITISKTVFSPQDWGINEGITVTATDDAGKTTTCNIIVVVRYPLNVGELDPFARTASLIDTQLEVLVYPNPTKGKFYMDIIHLNNPRVTAVVYNTAGAVVMVKELVTDGRVDMDLTGKVSGMYLLRLIADDKEFMHKIIKE